jgi:uncharacterized protein Yka (UPF0111/DUF47 family)
MIKINQEYMGELVNETDDAIAELKNVANRLDFFQDALNRKFLVGLVSLTTIKNKETMDELAKIFVTIKNHTKELVEKVDKVIDEAHEKYQKE